MKHLHTKVARVLDDEDFDSDDSADEGEGWFSRTKRGGKTLGAAAIFLASLALLFWNEGASKHHSDALYEAAKQVQEVSGTAIDPALDGKPVHLSALVHSDDGAVDPFFGIKTTGVALYRHVLMYQWIEYQETTGRKRNKKTTYTYEMDWDSEYHDSSQFHEPAGHQNPKPALESESFFAADARFGPYRFDNARVTEQAFDDFGDTTSPGSLGRWPSAVDNLPGISSSLQSKRWYQLDSGTYYRGNAESEDAELGDLQVGFYGLSNDFQLTLLAAQQGDRLVPFQASNGDRIQLAAGGTFSAKALIKMEERASAGRTSLFRTIGLIGSIIGAAGMASWLGGILTMIPILGRLVSLSLMIAGGLFGLLAGLTTIVVGWLSARPWVAALILIAIGSAVTWAIRKRRETLGKEKRASRAAELGAMAREKAAQALGAGPPPLVAAGAGVAMPPPPPPGPVAGSGKPMARNSAAARPPQRPMPMPMPPPPLPPTEEESRELPPLEWTPGLITTKPPAVRPRTSPEEAAPSAWDPPAPAAKPQAAPAPSAAPLFETVEARQAPAPLFDTVPVREVPSTAPATAQKSQSAPLFETVEARPPAPAPVPAATPKPVRVALGSKGDYQLNKIVRQQSDGAQQVLCFELMKAGKPIKRGTQEEVKEALRQALTGG